MQRKHPLRQVTLCFLLRNNQVLLAMKKKGFGKDKWNGIGGKLEAGDTVEGAAARELKEEIKVTPKSLAKMAKLNFYFPRHPTWDQQVIVFLVRDWEGEPQETEEMSPRWFDTDKIPFEKMWPADIHWLPLVLGGKKVQAEILYGEGAKLLEFKLKKG